MSDLQTDVDGLLKEVPTWVVATVLERQAFKDAMRNRAYGFAALLDAWTWFDAGWHADR